MKHTTHRAARLQSINSYTQFQCFQADKTNQICAICHLPNVFGICHLCFSLLPWCKYYCQHCLAPMPSSGICGKCQKSSPLIQNSVVAFEYRQPISNILHNIKYKAQLRYTSILTDCLTIAILQQKHIMPEIIIPIPLHITRLQQRGYNQAGEIAKNLSQRLHIPINWNALERRKNTTAQINLSETERKQNLLNAFTLDEPIEAKSILLVDDVITSGSTIKSAAKALHASGKISITACAIAKT